MIICGDCIEEMKKLPDNSIDAIITDPPYDLTSQRVYSKEKDVDDIKGNGTLNRNIKENSCYGSLVGGFMGKQWDGTGIAFKVETWKEALRVLKPGGHLLSFGGTRTYHRMACAIEDAGFEIRDCIEWVYGSGFPKSLNIGKAIDKMQGNEREEYLQPISYPDSDCWSIPNKNSKQPQWGIGIKEEHKNQDGKGNVIKTKGNSEWEGWGTALKPAHEPIVLARKPLSEKTVAENVLKWGTGGINIDESRVACNDLPKEWKGNSPSGEGRYNWNLTKEKNDYIGGSNIQGRFPANLIHDGLEEDWARFFYCAKASKSERNFGCEELEYNKENLQGLDTRGRILEREDGSKTLVERWKGNPTKNNHPTVKPIKLMEYLIKLVTPKGGTVLDPFMGSGTTGCACAKLGFNFIGIEKEPEYVKIAEARIKPYLEQEKLK